MTQPSILVAEDDAAVRELISIHVRMQGFDVLAADSGAGALALVVHRLGGGIIDLQLPDLNGVEVASALRRAQPGVPIVLISGAASERLRPAFSPDLAGVPLLAKPIDWEELWRALDRGDST